MLFLGTSKWALLAKVAQKNGTSGTRTKILRPLLQVQHCTKMMELPLGLNVFHFWVGFEPIFKFAFFPLYFTLCTQKDKEHYFRTFFRPNQKSKIARNGKTNTNPTGSSHGEQLVPKRLTLLLKFLVKYFLHALSFLIFQVPVLGSSHLSS